MKWLALIAVALVLAACGGDGSDAGAPPTGTSPVTIVATDPPAIQDGHHKAVMADGTEIAYSIVLPEHFDPAKLYPVLLALPPGGQDQEVVDSVARPGLEDGGEEARLDRHLPRCARSAVLRPGGGQVPAGAGRRRWSASTRPRAVSCISPASRTAACRRSARRSTIPGCIVDLLTFPGYPPEQTDDVAKLKRIPVAIWVGELDSGWRENGEATVAKLKSLGDSAQITVVPGETHILESVGGKEYFDFLEQQRPTYCSARRLRDECAPSMRGV